MTSQFCHVTGNHLIVTSHDGIPPRMIPRDREPPAADVDDPGSSSCVYEFISSSSLRSGRVYSPRYPRNFPADVDCVYRFQAATTTTSDHEEKIVISLLSVQLGQPPGRRHTSRLVLLLLRGGKSMFFKYFFGVFLGFMFFMVLWF